MSLIRSNVAGIAAYVAGKPIEETKRELGLKKVIKLASNENPLGVSPKAIAAIKKAAWNINRYPDSNGFNLKKKLSVKYGLKPQNVLLGNGSDEIIDIIIKAFVEDDENIITADATFLEYKIVAGVNNRKIVTVPLKYFKYDLEAIKRKVDKKTKLIFIANPNNPTGTYVTRQEVADFVKSLPANVLVVLDEAYETFIDVDDFPKSIAAIGNDNVIIMKTFSKVYGLAGLRIGYALGVPELIAAMEKVRQPFNTNMLAQAGAIAVLDDKKFIKKTRKAILEGKKYLYEEFRKMGIAYVPSVANFILFDCGRETTAFFRSCLKFGVIVRDMKQYGLNNYIRVTIGTKKENQRFVKVLKKVLK